MYVVIKHEFLCINSVDAHVVQAAKSNKRKRLQKSRQENFLVNSHSVIDQLTLWYMKAQQRKLLGQIGESAQTAAELLWSKFMEGSGPFTTLPSRSLLAKKDLSGVELDLLKVDASHFVHTPKNACDGDAKQLCKFLKIGGEHGLGKWLTAIVKTEKHLLQRRSGQETRSPRLRSSAASQAHDAIGSYWSHRTPSVLLSSRRP